VTRNAKRRETGAVLAINDVDRVQSRRTRRKIVIMMKSVVIENAADQETKSEFKVLAVLI
jgi:hypothetical protein